MSNVFKTMSKNGSSAFNKMGGALERFNRKTKKMQKLGAKAAGFLGIAGGALLVKNAIGGAITKGVEFEKTMVSASVKFVDGAKRGTKAFDELKKTALEVGRTTEFTATQAAQGLDFLAMAGFNSEQALKALPGVVDLATASNVDLAAATDMASDSLGAFNLMTKDSEQLRKNLARVNDVLAKTTTTANTTMESMFETIKTAGPIATAAGASIEEFSALTGLLANAGIKGTQAGTTLKNMFINLQAPTKAQSKLLRQMRIQIKDATGQMLPMSKILGQLNEKTTKMSKVQKNATVATLFGKRAVAGSIVLMNQGEKAIEKYTDQLRSATGATKDMATEMRNTTEGRIKKMNSAIEGLQLQLFEALQPAMEVIVDKVGKMAEAIGKFVKANPKTIKLIGAIAIALGVVTTALIAATAVMWLFNAAVAMNPFVLIGAAIAGVIIMIATLVDDWTYFFDFLLSNWQTVVMGIIAAIAPFNPVLAGLIYAASLIIENWAPIKTFFTNLWNGIVSGFWSAISAIKRGLNLVGGIINGLPGMGGTFDVSSSGGGSNQLVNPQIAASKSISESYHKSSSELLIRDETGRAELKSDKKQKGGLISMERTAMAGAR